MRKIHNAKKVEIFLSAVISVAKQRSVSAYCTLEEKSNEADDIPMDEAHSAMHCAIPSKSSGLVEECFSTTSGSILIHYTVYCSVYLYIVGGSRSMACQSRRHT